MDGNYLMLAARLAREAIVKARKDATRETDIETVEDGIREVMGCSCTHCRACLGELEDCLALLHREGHEQKKGN